MYTTVPESLDAGWFCKNAPIGLGLTSSTVALDCVAARVVGDRDEAYPFLIRERDGRLVSGFSDLGPARPIRDSIVTALDCRLLFAAK